MVSTADLPFNVYSRHTVESWLSIRVSRRIGRSHLSVHRSDVAQTEDLFIQAYETDLIRIGPGKIWATCNGYPTATVLKYLRILTGLKWKLDGGCVAVSTPRQTWFMSPKDMVAIKQVYNGGLIEYIFPDNVVLPQVNPIHVNELCRV